MSRHATRTLLATTKKPPDYSSWIIHAAATLSGSRITVLREIMSALAARVRELNQRAAEVLSLAPVTELTSSELASSEHAGPSTHRRPIAATHALSTGLSSPVAATRSPAAAPQPIHAQPASSQLHSTATAHQQPPRIAADGILVGGAARWRTESGELRTSGVVTEMTPWVAELTSDEEAALAAFARAGAPAPPPMPPPPPSVPLPPSLGLPPSSTLLTAGITSGGAKGLAPPPPKELEMESYRYVRELLSSVAPPSSAPSHVHMLSAAAHEALGTTPRASSHAPLAEISISMSLHEISHALESSSLHGRDSAVGPSLAPWGPDVLDASWVGPPEWKAVSRTRASCCADEQETRRRRAGSLVDGVPPALCVTCFDSPCACADL